MRLLFVLALALYLLVVSDAITTYVCLAFDSPHFVVWETNPLSRWLFESVGLLSGLIISGTFKSLTILALCYGAHKNPRHRRKATIVVAVMVAWTGYAVHNNWSVYQVLTG
jgi:hypothetical protein